MRYEDYTGWYLYISDIIAFIPSCTGNGHERLTIARPRTQALL